MKIISNNSKSIDSDSIPVWMILPFWLCSHSILSVIFLLLESFSPIIVLALSTLTTIVTFLLLRKRVLYSFSPFSWGFLIIVFLVLCLRIKPNLYITGGQDQGSYVALSKQYEVEGSLYIHDDFRDSLNQYGKDLYDASNEYLGIEQKDISSDYTIPFYPILPSWMATFSATLGSDFGIYAISIFSLLSIGAVYLFTYYLTSNRTVSNISALLLATNPLHVYFSRIPLTEVFSITFFFLMMAFFLKFFQSYREDKKWSNFDLILSLLCGVSLFFTKMSALIFLPIIWIIPVSLKIFGKDKCLTKIVTDYSIAWTVLLIISYIFYFSYIPELYETIIGTRILRYINYLQIAMIASIALILTWIFSRIKKVNKAVKKLYLWININISKIFLLVVCVSIFYELYYYINEILVTGEYSLMSFESLSYFKQQSFLVPFLYLSPIGFGILLWGSLSTSEKKSEYFFVFLSLIIYLIFYWVGYRLTPYHYYFARYQLSEILPFSIILIASFLYEIRSRKNGKRLSRILLLLILLYSMFFSVIQLRDFEGSSGKGFDSVKEVVEEEDVLFIIKSDFESFNQIVYPLKYYYEINVFPIETYEMLGDKLSLSINKEYNNKYILTTDPQLEIDGVVLEEGISFDHNYLTHCLRSEDSFFDMESSTKDLPLCKYLIIPNRFYRGIFNTYLYRWD